MSATVLSDDRIDQFWADGHLRPDNAMSPEQLAATRGEFERWCEESGGYDQQAASPVTM